MLADRTGTIDIKVWGLQRPPWDPAQIGKAVKIRGTVSEFKGAADHRGPHPHGGDHGRVRRFQPGAGGPIDPEAALEDVRGLISSMTDSDYRRVAETMLERHLEAFRKIPAAKKRSPQLSVRPLMHTGNMLKAADFLSRLLFQRHRPEPAADRNPAPRHGQGAGIRVLGPGHRYGILYLRATAGPSGHGRSGGGPGLQGTGHPGGKIPALAAPHLVPPRGAGVRAAVVPMCAEAELLSYIDMVDSRMEIYAEKLPEVPVGKASQRIFLPWISAFITTAFPEKDRGGPKMENVLFINACVRPDSRTRILAQEVLDCLGQPYTEVDLNRSNTRPWTGRLWNCGKISAGRNCGPIPGLPRPGSLPGRILLWWRHPLLGPVLSGAAEKLH